MAAVIVEDMHEENVFPRPFEYKKIEIPCQWKVELTYFKESGKLYSSAAYTSYSDSFFKLIEEARALLSSGTRPGLCDGQASNFHIVLNSNHPLGYPHMFPIGSIRHVGRVAQSTPERKVYLPLRGPGDE